MTLQDFVSKHVETAQEHGPLTTVDFIGRELRQRLLGPQHHVETGRPNGVPLQSDLLTDALGGDEPTWLFWFDGGRVDGFRELAPEYVTGDLQTCWNGGIGYSGDWADRHLRRDLGDYGLFSVAPVRSLQGTDYDGRDYFHCAPEIDTGDSVHDRLAALGYREQKGDRVVEIAPGHCNRTVREHIDDIEGGIVRYLKPHPPFEGVEGISSGSGKTRATWHALWSGEITQDELRERYMATYRQAFEAAVELIPDLDGDVYITADHGECLGDCGQLYHSSQHATHRHLCEVPWFEVDGLA